MSKAMKQPARTMDTWERLEDLSRTAGKIELALREQIEDAPAEAPMAALDMWGRTLDRITRLAIEMQKLDDKGVRARVTQEQITQTAEAWQRADALWVDGIRHALPPEVHPTLDAWVRTERPRLTRQALVTQTGQPSEVT